MLIAPSSYGALSATSANTIQGHKPGFSGQSGAKKLGFKVGNISYSEANPVLGGSNTDKDKIEPGTPKLFEPSLRLNEFVVQGLTVNDFTVVNDYFDADGDIPATPAFTVGTVSHQWLDGNGNLIADENKMVGCSAFSQPLTLKINLDAQSHSQYGAPRDSDPAGLEQSYQIKAPSGICFAKPNQMIVDPAHTWVGTSGGNTYYWNNASYKARNQYGGGYDPNQFDPENGFKASLNPKFPTTGFSKASFTLIVVGDASDYTFTHNVGSRVTVGADGKVTLNSKPNGAVTIKAKYNATSEIHEYTFDPRTVWVAPQRNSATASGPSPYIYYSYGEAKTACGGNDSRIPSRAQLTNSPRNTAPEDWAYEVNAYTRKVDGSLFGEWGYTGSTTYPGSQWMDNKGYWTRDPSSSINQYRVFSSHGVIDFNYKSSSNYIACLG
ncbi:hypothetical protein RCS94_00490 [Orbaceae bacterium ac157xtp]